MKFESIINNYKKIGYIYNNQNDEKELELLINWIYKKYNIFIHIEYIDNISQKCLKNITNVDVNYFVAHIIFRCSTKESHKILPDKYYDNPYDAKFYSVKLLFNILKNYK